ncbi:unnamed protein product [Sphagnum compactum]
MRNMRSCQMMKILLLLLSFMMLLSMTAMAISDSADTSALIAFKNGIIDRSNKLSNWQGNDPCGDKWNGVICGSTNSSTNVSRVSELRLLNFNLGGQLAPELGNLSQLSILNVMRNHINGTIPSSIGNLQNLVLLLLNGNYLTGSIPSELGQLTKLIRLQLDQNQLSGPLPPSLGNMTQVQHLHMNNNSFSGSIPAQLGRLQNLLHLLLDNNDMEGPLPEDIANISTITIVQLDNNPKIASMIPQQWVQIPSLIKLSLKNCSLYGPIPELGALTNLQYVDLSLNKLSGGLPSNLSSILVTVNFADNSLTGLIPDSYGSQLQQLQALQLANNFLNGTIPASLGSGQSFSNKSNTLLVDLQNNNLTGLDTELLFEAIRSTKINVWLAGNQELCSILATTVSLKVCTPYDGIIVLQGNTSSSNSQAPNSTCRSCSPPSMPVVDVASQVCQCAQPIPVVIQLISPGFSFFDRFIQRLISLLEGALNISASQIQSYDWDTGERLTLTLLLFPPNSTFNSIEIDKLYTAFSTFTLSSSTNWSLSVVGPYELLYFNAVAVVQSTSKGLSTGSIVGIVVGAVAFVAILAAFATLLILLRHHKKRRRLMVGTLPPGVKIAGVKGFTYEELAKASKGFSPENEIGQGGYGKVYRGTLEDDTIVGIKRAMKESMQGAHQFYTEIELLSRLHHRNLVQLIGYCNDKGEQMLVYEFMVNGNLRDHLIPTEEMDFARRIHIALGTARGILYLHTEANPPIFHRDIKANNILLDRDYNAKVADFGLSKLAPEPNVDDATPEHVSTTVKGTPGYMDPQYFMTNKFTDKSDVYSFGIVLLELITGMMPISRGKYILREVKEALEANKISSIIDPCMGTSYPPDGLDRLLKLALSCCSQEYEERPQMIDLTRELEDIWRLTAASYPMLRKMDSDISSHNFGTMGQSSQTSGPYMHSRSTFGARTSQGQT